MSAAADQSRRSYDFHGIGVAIHAEDPAVAGAVERRLSGFPPSTSAFDAQLRLEYLIAESADRFQLEAPAGQSRPIYSAPEGEILYFPEADTVYAELEGVRVFCEAGSGLARIESAEFSERRLYVASHPLTTISLNELLKRRGLFAMHAGCVSSAGNGVLLPGASGAGKSTLTLALVAAGMSFLSDDTVFLRRCPSGIQVLGFADAVGVSQQTIAQLAGRWKLTGVKAPAGFPKYLLRIDEDLGVPSTAGCAPAVIVFPKVVGAPTSGLLPLEPKDGWLRLVPDVLLTEPVSTQAHLEALAALLGQVSCHELSAGRELKSSVRLLRGLL